MLVGTTYVVSDEPCFGLKEENLMSPLDGQWHRYQILYVVRDDALTEYREDLGLAKSFVAQQIFIPGGERTEDGKIYIEETVGRLKDIANELRSQSTKDFWEVAKGG